MIPEIRLAYIPTFGDRYIDTNVSLAGVPGRYTQSGVMLDENAGNVGPGLAWRSHDNKLGMGASRLSLPGQTGYGRIQRLRQLPLLGKTFIRLAPDDRSSRIVFCL